MQLRSRILLLLLVAIVAGVEATKVFCNADLFLVKQKLKEGKKAYPHFNNPFICQVWDGVITGSISDYSKCVKDLIKENLKLEKGALFNSKNRLEIRTKLKENKQFAMSLYKCQNLLENCSDVAN